MISDSDNFVKKPDIYPENSLSEHGSSAKLGLGQARLATSAGSGAGQARLATSAGSGAGPSLADEPCSDSEFSG